MTDNKTSEWAALETDVGADGTFAPPTTHSAGVDARVVHYPCPQCGGSGRYLGRRTAQPRGECFACGGKGYFLTSERDRAQARVRRVARQATDLAKSRAAFEAANPGLARYLEEATWSSFAQDLCTRLRQVGSLHPAAVDAARGMQAKCAARSEARRAERVAGSTVVDLSLVRAMFEAARASGHKMPVYRAAGLVINRAPDSGRNPGALYVKSAEDDSYLGKIIGSAYTGKPAPGLAAIAADPRGEAVAYGQRTGTCSCCGRTLTATDSIEAGIGPICAARWGL